MSCVLFHGPGARAAALREADRIGRLVVPPLGDDGLTVAEARQAVELLLSPPVGEQIGVVVLGPLDEARGQSTDALLKTLEESSGRLTQPILWAHDIGGVSPTIQSRCFARWAGQADGVVDDEALMNAMAAVDATLSGDLAALLSAVKDLAGGNDGQSKVARRSFLSILCGVLAEDLDKPQHRALWERLRKVAHWTNPTKIEIVAALLPDE